MSAPIFGFNQVYALAGWAALTFLQLSDKMPSSSKDRKSWYDENKPSWAVPGYMFPFVWTLMYSALTIAMYYFTRNVQPDSWNIITGVTLYIFHILCNKLWSVAFWNMRSPFYAGLILLFPTILSACGLVVAFIVNQSGLFWVPVMCLSIYVAWLFYAAAINIYWINNNLPVTNQREKAEIKSL